MRSNVFEVRKKMASNVHLRILAQAVGKWCRVRGSVAVGGGGGWTVSKRRREDVSATARRGARRQRAVSTRSVAGGRWEREGALDRARRPGALNGRDRGYGTVNIITCGYQTVLGRRQRSSRLETDLARYHRVSVHFTRRNQWDNTNFFKSPKAHSRAGHSNKQKKKKLKSKYFFYEN